MMRVQRLSHAGAGHDVQPRLTAVAVARLIEPGRELVHDRGEARGVVTDGLVDQEEAPRAALGDEATYVVEPRDQSRGLGARPLAGESLATPGVRVGAFERRDLPGPGRQLRDRRVAAVPEQRGAAPL